MKKIIIVSILFILILISSILGTLLINKGNEIISKQDILIYQNELEKEFDVYGYTIDEPNVILNPYEISPLSALIMFETNDYIEIEVSILNKSNIYEELYISKKSKTHYLSIYGLYPNYENKIKLKYNDIEKIITIKTENLPSDIIIKDYHNITDGWYFETESNYLYAYDKNKDIRWYYKDNMLGNITKLNNNHFIISNNQIVSDNSTTGIIEIDLLGKIYYEYLIKDNYYGLTKLNGNNIIIHSDNYLSLDRQTGKTNIVEDNIISSNNNIKIDSINSYKKTIGIRFGNLVETKTSTTNTILLNYKKIDSKYEIVFTKEHNRLLIRGNFTNTDKVYIILDKFLGKRVYEMKDNYLCINDTKLTSKYNIYIKINDNLYKIYQYVEF